MDVVKAFTSELVSLYEIRPPISKKKMVDITKAAMKAIKLYKHVVLGVEKFIIKCKSEYKIPGLYVIDSIVRQSQHQFGVEKDVFGPRFAANLATTLKHLLACPEEDRQKIVRVLNLWLENKVFDVSVLHPLLSYCQSEGLDVDMSSVARIAKNETSLDSHGKRNSQATRFSPQTPPPRDSHETLDLTPRAGAIASSDSQDDATSSSTPTRSMLSERELHLVLRKIGLDTPSFSSDPVLLKQMLAMTNKLLAERDDLNTRTQGNIKNLLSQEFDYSDEEDSGGEESTQKKDVGAVATRPVVLTREQIISSAETLLRDPAIVHQIHLMHQERKRALVAASLAQTPLPGSSLPFPPNMPQHQRVGLLPTGMPGGNMAIPPPALPANVVAARVAQAVMRAPHNQQMHPGFMPNSSTFTSQPVPQSFAPLDQDDRRATRYDRDQHASGDVDERKMSAGGEKRGSRNRRGTGEEPTSGGRRRERSPSSRDRDERYTSSSSRSSKRARRSRSPRDRVASDRSGHRTSASRSLPPEKNADKERKKLGLPGQAKEGHLLVASRTLWLGRIPANCSEDDIRLAIIEAGEPERVKVILPRACAYVTMKDRRAAFKIIDKMRNNLCIHKKPIKLNWATGQGLKTDKYAPFWDIERGLHEIPYDQLGGPAFPGNLDELVQGGHLDVESIPANLRHLYNEFGLIAKVQQANALEGILVPPSIPPQQQLPAGLVAAQFAQFGFPPTGMPVAGSPSASAFFPAFGMPPPLPLPPPGAVGNQVAIAGCWVDAEGVIQVPPHVAFLPGPGGPRMPPPGAFNANMSAGNVPDNGGQPQTWNPHRGSGGFRGAPRGTGFFPRGGAFRGGAGQRGGGAPRFNRGGGAYGGFRGGHDDVGGYRDGDGGHAGGYRGGGHDGGGFAYNPRFRHPPPGEGFASAGFVPGEMPMNYNRRTLHGAAFAENSDLLTEDEKPIHIAVVSSSQQDDLGRNDEGDNGGHKMHGSGAIVNDTLVADSSGNDDYPPPGDD